jgi:hypothetical protein
MATKDVPPKKPRKYLWPAEAVNIAQKKQHPVRLCEELIALTGYDNDFNHGVAKLDQRGSAVAVQACAPQLARYDK